MSSPSSQPSPKDFQPVPLKEMVELLTDSARTIASTLVWTKNREHQLTSRMVFFDQIERSIVISPPKTAKAIQCSIQLERDKSQDCFFCISHSKANLFFVTKYINDSAAGLKFKVPEKMHKVQRRANIRYQIPIGRTMRITFQDPLYPEVLLQKKLVDISCGGLSFLIDAQDEPMYPIGLSLEGIEFTLRAKTIKTSAEIRYRKPNPDDPGVRVGVKFSNLSKNDDQLIYNYVNDEVRKLYMNYL